MMTREAIENEIRQFIKRDDDISTLCGKWRDPVVGFADARHPGFEALRQLVHPAHDLPRDIMPDARIVVSYFVPFSLAIVSSNNGQGLASPAWAQTYEETNAMFLRLNNYLIDWLKDAGVRAAVSPAAAAFDQEKLVSRWSQRHVAYLAGLGSFGLNNMLITEAGTCGRFSSIVTNLEITPDVPMSAENCLYKRNGTCGGCVRQCPSKALRLNGFDRNACYMQCLENAAVHTSYGRSYISETGGTPTSSGSEVCGKCLVGLPCSMKKP